MINHDLETRQQTSRQQRVPKLKKPFAATFLAGTITLGILAALLLCATAMADEKACLAATMYAESRGKSIEHNVVIGQTTIQKAKRESTTICKLKGVHRKPPTAKIKPYYEHLAAKLLKEQSTHLSKGADHWNSGTKPAFPGKITRQVDNHVFYVLTAD